MTEHEVAELKAALYNQYIINGKLIMELENEREASATAASEVLSMVLRLEREKALEMMEACQYKRITELKMCHIEECSVALERLIRLKEIEISVLKDQPHAYKQDEATYKLNKSVDIITFNALSKETGMPITARRCKSLPSLRLFMMNLETDGSDNRKPSFQSSQLVWRSARDTDLNTEIGACDSREVKGKKNFELFSGSNCYQISEHADLWSSQEKYAAYLQQSASSADTNKLNSNIEVFPGASCLISETGQENKVKPDEFVAFCNSMESGWINKSFDPEVDKCCLPGEPYKLFMDDPLRGTKKTIGMEDFALRNLDNMSLNGAHIHRTCRNKFSTRRKGVSLHQAFEVSTRTKRALMNYKSIVAKCGNEESSLDQNYTKRIQYAQDEMNLKLSGREERLKLFRKAHEQLKIIKHDINCDRPRKCHLNDEPKVAHIMEAALSFSI